MRVVFDTNIFISAFVIPGGNAEEAYLHAVRGTLELFSSVSILTETANTLRTKFGWSDAKVQDLLRSISKTATVLKTEPHLHVVRDEPDNRILECALLAEADIILTGDRHL
ncbi:MAG: putative toxin-antitoxin system toxin component, PIN family, partial [Candidatus Methylomirabilia bacterium]